MTHKELIVQRLKLVIEQLENGELIPDQLNERETATGFRSNMEYELQLRCFRDPSKRAIVSRDRCGND